MSWVEKGDNAWNMDDTEERKMTLRYVVSNRIIQSSNITHAVFNLCVFIQKSATEIKIERVIYSMQSLHVWK